MLEENKKLVVPGTTRLWRATCREIREVVTPHLRGSPFPAGYPPVPRAWASSSRSSSPPSSVI